MARCSICHTLIAEHDEATSCEDCHIRYHAECWTSVGGCATYGCGQAAVAHKPTPVVRPGGGWGDTKTCPVCKQEIQSSLLRCACGAHFPWADPMTAHDYLEWSRTEERNASTRRSLIWLFVFTLLAAPAPLTGALAGVQAHRNRHDLEGSNGVYLALGYGTAALGGLYAILFLLVAFGL